MLANCQTVKTFLIHFELFLLLIKFILLFTDLEEYGRTRGEDHRRDGHRSARDTARVLPARRKGTVEITVDRHS